MTSRSTRNTVPSPCIDRCSLDPQTEVCRGCGRHLDEISAWATATEAERLEIVARAQERRKAQL